MKLRRRVIMKRIEVRVDVPDWRSEEYDRITKALREEAADHTPSHSHTLLGDLGWGQNWHCAQCRSPYPCRFVRWAHRTLGERDDEFGPLRIMVVGEQIDGSGVQFPDGGWVRVDGIERVECVRSGLPGQVDGP